MYRVKLVQVKLISCVRQCSKHCVHAALTSQPSANPIVKSSVTFPIFRGDECEDVHEFIRNYKRAGRLNGWSEVNLALGFTLYLKGHASGWFKTLPTPDEMTFDQLSAELTKHFASGASEWRVRQALGQRRQLEKETVADFSYSLRTHCARLNLPRSEWIHYFVQGLLPEIREYVVLQQPENLEAAENYAKLKESVLANSVKLAAFYPKEVSAQILEELSKAAKGKAVGAVGQTDPYVNKSEMKQIIREEFRELMGNSSSRPNRYNQSNNTQSFQQRSFRSRFGNNNNKNNL